MSLFRHSLLVGDDLHVPGYRVATDPGAVGAGMLWEDTDTGTLYKRNLANTGWVPLGGSSQLFYVVTDYGALGDDSTNDTAAIQAAITAASADTSERGLVWFPEGSYKFTQLVIPNGVRLRGGGVGGFSGISGGTYGAQLRQIAGTNLSGIVFEGSLFEGVRYVGPIEISDLILVGDTTATAGSAINFITAAGVLCVGQDTMSIHNLLIRGWKDDGIRLGRGAKPIHIHDVNCLFNGRYGIYYEDTDTTGTQAVHFDNISGDGNLSGLIYCKGVTDYGSLLFTNIKSEKRINTHYSSAVGQENAILLDNCTGPVAVHGLTHISSVPSGSYYEAPGAAIKIQGTNIPSDVTFDAVAVRVRPGDTGSPYTINDVTSSRTVPYTQHVGHYPIERIQGSVSGLYAGAGSPEGVVAGALGSIYARSNGGAGTTLYVKESFFGTALAYYTTVGGAGWTDGGTPTRTAAAITVGGIPLDLLGDDSTTVAEYVTRDIAFTTDGRKGISVLIQRFSAFDSQEITLFSIEQNAVVGRVYVNFSAATPTLTFDGGASLLSCEAEGTAWRLIFLTGNVESTDRNILLVYPAGHPASGTASWYIGDIRVYDDGGLAGWHTSVRIPTQAVGAYEWDVVASTAALVALTDSRRRAMAFDAAVEEIVQKWVYLQAGTYTVSLYWTNLGAGVGDVYWQVQWDDYIAGDNASANEANTIQSGVITAPAQDILKISACSSTMVVTANALVSLRVKRTAANAGDTLANDAGLISLVMVPA